MAEIRPERHSILARDAAAVRLRRLTVAALAAGGAIAGTIAGVAASSNHSGTAVRSALPATRANAIPAVPAPAATTPVAGDPQASAAAAATAPAASSAAPIVVSGGS
jgi:hypothetical protein